MAERLSRSRAGFHNASHRKRLRNVYRLRGWRGQTAVRFTLGGFALLVVGFYGTKVVLDLAATHDARLQIDSRLGEGTTFRLDFPHVAMDVPGAVGAASPQKSS